MIQPLKFRSSETLVIIISSFFQSFFLVVNGIILPPPSLSLSLIVVNKITPIICGHVI